MDDIKYFKDFTPVKSKIVGQAIGKMKAKGITNHFIIAAILAVISKESDFQLHEEISYRRTNNDRIRKIFAKRIGTMPDEMIDKLKADDEAFFNHVYAGIIGNNKDGDGWKYRGRGLNQLTGKANYAHYGEIARLDLLNHPELLSNLDIAIDVAIAYMIDHIKHAPTLQKTAYRFEGINDFKTETDAANAAYNANAGWGKSPATCRADTTGGYVRTHARIGGFLEIVSSVL